MSRIWISGALYLAVLLALANGQICSGDKIRKCIAVGEPMMKDPNQIFPDNLNDINNVCRKWSNFVDCIRRYIDKCLSKVSKDQFNSAVEPPISSVHHMCSDPVYQAEYLQYAGCMKSTVIEAEHCGNHYSVLLNEVSQEPSRKPNLCCAYHNLRSCVITKTRLRCDGNRPDGIAAKFARQVLDKALHITQDQCLNYTHEPGKCSSMMSSSNSRLHSISRLGEGRSVTLESSPTRNTNSPIPDLYDTLANSLQSTSTRHDRLPHNNLATSLMDARTSSISSSSSSRQTPVTSGPLGISGHHARQTLLQQQQQQQQQASSNKPDDHRATKPEEGTSRKAEPTHYTPIVENPVPIATATQRPSSYGRGIAWTTPTTPFTSEIPDWATNTWLTHGQDLTTEEIYPAAGSFGGNNIDEPNQQGLSRNGQQPVSVSSLVYIFIFAAYNIRVLQLS